MAKGIITLNKYVKRKYVKRNYVMEQDLRFIVVAAQNFR